MQSTNVYLLSLNITRGIPLTPKVKQNHAQDSKPTRTMNNMKYVQILVHL
ncbi:hypothetical protein Hanom_Chr02g00169111 [Helianthus anomalus]